jgi:hypothetical protein
MLVLCLALAGCGPAVASSTPPSTQGASPPPAEPTAGPETDEDRARAVLNELEGWCADHTPECGAALVPEAYPEVTVSESDRRFVTDRDQELRSLGIQLRWDPNADHLEVERGNTPTFGGDRSDDP